MSRRRSSRDLEEPGRSREATIEALLDDLCVTFGFCLEPGEKEALRTSPPAGARAFTDAVITAEGLDPAMIDSSLRRGMVEMVESKAGRIL